MAETLVRFTEAVTGRDGRQYIASARGIRGSDGLWHGWLEFSDGTTSLRTTQESEQPNRDDLMYWAQGLTYVYLEGALERARSRDRRHPRSQAVREVRVGRALRGRTVRSPR